MYIGTFIWNYNNMVIFVLEIPDCLAESGANIRSAFDQVHRPSEYILSKLWNSCQVQSALPKSEKVEMP